MGDRLVRPPKDYTPNACDVFRAPFQLPFLSPRLCMSFAHLVGELSRLSCDPGLPLSLDLGHS